MPLRTLVFDFDGTLHDCSLIYPAAVRYGYAWLVEQGLAPTRCISDAECVRYIGFTAKDMWADFAPGLADEAWQHAAALVGQAMDAQISQGKAHLYPGVPQALDKLTQEGYQLVFLSNCRDAYQLAAREAFGLDQWFSGYYYAEKYPGLPKERIFDDIARAFPSDFAMIGDRASDKRVSDVHGIPFVACTYGYGTAEEWKGSDAFAHSASEIPACIEKLAAE